MSYIYCNCEIFQFPSIETPILNLKAKCFNVRNVVWKSPSIWCPLIIQNVNVSCPSFPRCNLLLHNRNNITQHKIANAFQLCLAICFNYAKQYSIRLDNPLELQSESSWPVPRLTCLSIHPSFFLALPCCVLIVNCNFDTHNLWR